jgi:hypothetical protein
MRSLIALVVVVGLMLLASGSAFGRPQELPAAQAGEVRGGACDYGCAEIDAVQGSQQAEYERPQGWNYVWARVLKPGNALYGEGTIGRDMYDTLGDTFCPGAPQPREAVPLTGDDWMDHDDISHLHCKTIP